MRRSILQRPMAGGAAGSLSKLMCTSQPPWHASFTKAKSRFPR
jgi:hypothetical protein